MGGFGDFQRKEFAELCVCVCVFVPTGGDCEEIKWDLRSGLALPVSRGTERDSSRP